MRLLHVQKAAHYSGLAGRMLFFVVVAVRTPTIAENNSHGHRSMPMTQRQEEERNLYSRRLLSYQHKQKLVNRHRQILDR